MVMVPHKIYQTKNIKNPIFFYGNTTELIGLHFWAKSFFNWEKSISFPMQLICWVNIVYSAMDLENSFVNI